MDDLTNDDIHSILDDAERLLPVARGETYLPLLQGKILGNLFFEPSTRTRMSFETVLKNVATEHGKLSRYRNPVASRST